MTDLRGAIIRTRRLPPLLRFVLLAIVQSATNDGFGPARVAALQNETGIPPEPLSKALAALRESGDIDLDDKNNVSLSGKYRDQDLVTNRERERARAREGKPDPKRVPLTEAHIIEFEERYAALGNVRERIADALGHQAASKRFDMPAYVNRWLLDDQRRLCNGTNNRPANQPPPYRPTGGAQRSHAPRDYLGENGIK